ncbi:MAG TPA: hypothetical protein VGE74_10820 [Gemmata sp.]
MSKKNHSPGPVPPANRPHLGTSFQRGDQDEQTDTDQGASFQEQDPERRLGDYMGTGEHSLQQPGPKNNGGSRHGEDAG